MRGQRNPHFGWWPEADGDDGWRPDSGRGGLVEGRAFVLPYRERLKHFPTCDEVGGISFERIVYPKRKKDYDAIVALARRERDRCGLKNNPYLYELPEWFRRKGREKYSTLYYYIQAKALRDEGIVRFSHVSVPAR